MKMFLASSSQIYKATCKGYQERLVDDLKKTMIEHCQTLQKQLDENVRRLIRNCQDILLFSRGRSMIIFYNLLIIFIDFFE